MPIDQSRLRREICFAAAQLLSSRRETNFTHAKWRAARSITRCYIRVDNLPTDMEIRVVLQQIMAAGGHSVVLDSTSAGSRHEQFLLSLLLPLDRVQQPRDSHPEGDVLYHSLQVFELAREHRDWDEDFLMAALFHDIGKGIDPFDHVGAALRVLKGHITERTHWLIENHTLAHRIADGTIGARAWRRLSQSEDGETLKLLASCDREGRVPGRIVCTPQEALAFIYALSEENDDSNPHDTSLTDENTDATDSQYGW